MYSKNLKKQRRTWREASAVGSLGDSANNMRFNSTGGAGYAAAEAAFAARWDEVNRTVPSRTPQPTRRAELDRQWSQLLTGDPTSTGLAGSLLAIEPLFAGACADEECVGVRVADQACVCPTAA